jgi:AcrR family transcriptional regulator
MTPKKTGGKKEKLLVAASEVFIEKGFREATVAEICARAEANVAAVNYYFGSKEALYQEAWRHSFEESLVAYPMEGGASESAPPEERLRGLLTALIQRIGDQNNKDFLISQMEIMNPTSLLQEVMDSELIPMREKTLSLVRELLGPQATEQQVVFCEISIISMCIHPMIMQRIGKRNKDKNLPPLIEDIKAFADHVVTFALAGMEAVCSNQGTS